MADRAHLDILEQSVVAWNSWRERNPSIEPNLVSANLWGANLTRANLRVADLSEADLYGANLLEADLSRATLRGANLRGADLSEADLTSSVLVKTNLTGATLTGCRIYGISAWSLKLEGTIQQNLNVSDEREPDVMVDNLEVAQFIYLLLNNERIRQVIDTITSKVVLILGRFTPVVHGPCRATPKP